MWTFDTKKKIRGSPTLDSDTVYVGADTGALYAIHRETGEPRWTLETTSRRVRSPTLADDTVIVTTGEAVLAADRDTGTEVWRFGDKRIMSEPTVAGDDVFVYATDRTGWRLHCLDVRTGRRRWTISDSADPAEQFHSNLAVTDDTVCAGTWGHIHGIDRHDGKVQWSIDRSQPIEWIHPRGGTLYAGARTTASAANVIAIRPSDGRSEWEQTTREGEWITSVTSTERTLFVSGIKSHGYGSKTRRVTALSPATGSIRWSVQTSTVSSSSVPPRAVSIQLETVIASSDRTLVYIDERSGQVLERIDLPEEIHTQPTVADGRVYVGTDDGVVWAFDHEH